jgi:hypothetical protein
VGALAHVRISPRQVMFFLSITSSHGLSLLNVRLPNATLSATSASFPLPPHLILAPLPLTTLDTKQLHMLHSGSPERPGAAETCVVGQPRPFSPLFLGGEPEEKAGGRPCGVRGGVGGGMGSLLLRGAEAELSMSWTGVRGVLGWRGGGVELRTNSGIRLRAAAGGCGDAMGSYSVMCLTNAAFTAHGKQIGRVVPTMSCPRLL